MFDEAAIRGVYPNPADAAAMAYPDGSCRVIIGNDTPTDQVGFCDVLTHELGHLAGFGHVAVGAFPASSPMAAMTAPAGHWDGCKLTLTDFAVATLRSFYPGKHWGCVNQHGRKRCVVRLSTRRVQTVTFRGVDNWTQHASRRRR